MSCTQHPVSFRELHFCYTGTSCSEFFSKNRTTLPNSKVRKREEERGRGYNKDQAGICKNGYQTDTG
jgi:hypothetical protein